MTDTFTIGTHADVAADLSLPPQARTILAHLKRGKTITNNESMLVYGVYRLSDVVFKLRNAGYDILCNVKRDEVGRRYSQYKLVA
jgi:hypothetical protein